MSLPCKAGRAYLGQLGVFSLEHNVCRTLGDGGHQGCGVRVPACRQPGGMSGAGSGFQAREKDVELLRKKAARGRRLKDACPGVGAPVNDQWPEPPGEVADEDGCVGGCLPPQEISRDQPRGDGARRTMEGHHASRSDPRGDSEIPTFPGASCGRSHPRPCAWLLSSSVWMCRGGEEVLRHHSKPVPLASHPQRVGTPGKIRKPPFPKWISCK